MKERDYSRARMLLGAMEVLNETMKSEKVTVSREYKALLREVMFELGVDTEKATTIESTPKSTTITTDDFFKQIKPLPLRDITFESQGEDKVGE